MGLEALTLYAFSSENWKRPADEIADLMGLLKAFIRSDLQELIDNNARLRIIGDYHGLAPISWSWSKMRWRARRRTPAPRWPSR
jgi:undecaprenyl diphosphate synthase